MRKAFVDAGIDMKEDGEVAENDGGVLISVKGEIYAIQNDYSWDTDIRNVYVMGSGGDIALGAMAALGVSKVKTAAQAENIIRKAIATAIEYDMYCSEPIHIFTQFKQETKMAINAENNFKVSATGGAGASGQGKKYIPGMNQMGSSGVETMAQQSAASMYKAPEAPTLSPITPLTAPTEFKDQSIMDGSMGGPGPNSVANLPNIPNSDPDIQSMQDHYPILEWWSSQPGASQATKDYVKYLGTIINGNMVQ